MRPASRARRRSTAALVALAPALALAAGLATFVAGASRLGSPGDALAAGLPTAAPPPSSGPGAQVVPGGSAPALPVVPDGSTLLKVEGARFSMGSGHKKAEPNETPVHLVTVSTFFIDQTEVTVGAYRACVDRGACAKPRLGSKHCTFDKGDAALPVNCVSFDEADRYCLAHGKRLPTEAEWELAARGTLAKLFPWGDEKPGCDRAVTLKGDATAETCGKDGPLAVGGRSRGKSPSGALDMAGNLEEWVADFYDDRLDASATVDPRGPKTGFAHVLRGGSWQSPRWAARATARSWGSSLERGATVGFRCAL